MQTMLIRLAFALLSRLMPAPFPSSLLGLATRLRRGSSKMTPRLFRAVGWGAIFIVATFLGKDFVLNVVNAINQLAPSV